MSSPTLFLGLLVLAALLVGLFVAWPLLRRRPAGIDAPAAEAARLNQDIIRERRQKLDEELAALPEGSPEREALMREFATGALADLAPADAPAATADAPRRRQLLAVVFITLLVALPLAFYRTTGMPEAVAPDFAEKSQMPDVNKMLAQLEARLEAEPEMVEGWLMLGRSRLALGEGDKAVAALERALKLDSKDPALAACEAVEGAPQAALRAACAVELIHAYSLVHDDMPCMDNDVLRRGKPTVHVRFGQAQALLAGDALQALAFEILTPEPSAAASADLPAAMQAALCRLLARAAGADGMAGGQAIDLASVGLPLTEPELRAMHRRKTGALLLASVRMGAACAAHPLPAAALQALDAYGQALGLAFQVVDDVLDVTADSALLGKTAGKDAAAGKPTYVSLLGLEAARQLATDLLAQAENALNALQASGLAHTQPLHALARQVVQRQH